MLSRGDNVLNSRTGVVLQTAKAIQHTRSLNLNLLDMLVQNCASGPLMLLVMNESLCLTGSLTEKSSIHVFIKSEGPSIQELIGGVKVTGLIQKEPL